MKLKNTILSIVRHVLTAGGTLLVAKGIADEATAQAIIGGVLAAASLIWGAGDEALAENNDA